MSGREPRPRVLVLCRLSETTFRRLRGLATVYECSGPDPIPDGILATIQAIVVRSDRRLEAEFLRRCPELRVIVRAGSGVDNIARDTADELGIRLMTVPEASRSVAEHALGLTLAVARRIPQLHQEMVGGHWGKAQGRGIELLGKTMVIVGFGRVGQHLSALAASFGMQTLAVCSRRGVPVGARILPGGFATLEEALPRADVLALCCTLTRETEDLIGEAQLAALPQDAIVINVARGRVLSERALLAALSSGRLWGAGLDVHARENPFESVLGRHPRCVLTPHVGAETAEARLRIEQTILRILEDLRIPLETPERATAQAAPS
jgi:D-3-phosphoglycerate dehydrogenase / 2-oxoglutarate reductase